MNTSSLKKMVRSKGFVTAMCAFVAVIVLIVGYNIRIQNDTKPVSVPVAKHKLTARQRITEEDVTYVNIPQAAISGNYYNRGELVIGQYVNIDTNIPEGSMFYEGAIVSADELPDEALLDVDEGEVLYYLNVNMLSSYLNSILPNRYIDLYMSTKDNDKALVGVLIKNIRVLQVKTSSGENVFENASEKRTPYVLMVSLPKEQHLLLRQVTAINNYSIALGGTNYSKIELYPVPTNKYYKAGDEEIQSTIASEYLRSLISERAEEVPDYIDDVEMLPGNNFFSNSNNTNVDLNGNGTGFNTYTGINTDNTGTNNSGNTTDFSIEPNTNTSTSTTPDFGTNAGLTDNVDITFE